jgi:Zn-dependent peptidase ImmA (M78 family)
MTPENAAAALLRSAGLHDLAAPPVDVDHLAEEHLGLDVQEHADLLAIPDAPALEAGTTLSGLLFPQQRRIWVNAVEAQRAPGRRRFTIAHELGHWQLHREAGGNAHARFCRTDEVGGSADELRRARAIEREANRFAAALLMPPDLVRAQARELRLNVAVMAQRFGVSGIAMQVRLEVLSLLPDYMQR